VSGTPACSVAVVDQALPAGLAANAVGVLALTLGASAPDLVGADLVDADGERHPGLIPHGLPVLAASQAALADLRRQANGSEVVVIDFPVEGQQTTDYEEFRRRVAEVPTTELAYLAVLVHGPRKAVRRLTGNFALLR